MHTFMKTNIAVAI